MRKLALALTVTMAFSAAVLAAYPAYALTFNFVPQLTGPDGTSMAFQSSPASGFTITAAGFSNSAALASGTPNVDLNGHVAAPVDENGLGLTNDIFGEGEISGTSLIRIAMNAGLTGPVTFTMESVTTHLVGGVSVPEGWTVAGSNSPMSGFMTLLSGNDEGVAHPLPFENFYTFASTGGNVLIGQMTAAAVPGPIVGAGLPGLVSALLGAALWWRRRKHQVA